jgi:DNA-binding MarR family transcriptional regulator
MSADREAWLLMSELVHGSERRRQVAAATGMTFGRSRALRRIAAKPMTMRELADTLGIEPPNATAVIADLEAQGYVQRKPHPTDGRAKIVEATRKGKALARKADDILATPPPELSALSADDLETLRRILLAIRPSV